MSEECIFTVPVVPENMETEATTHAKNEEAKENVEPEISTNVTAVASPNGKTKISKRSSRIGKRELRQVASPKSRWLPRTDKRRSHGVSRFEFAEKEAQPLWEVSLQHALHGITHSCET